MCVVTCARRATVLGINEASNGRSHLQPNSRKLPEVANGLASTAQLKESRLLMTPVPMGERRSSGVSAPHSTYIDESHLLVDVTVTDVKEDCALGLVLEHLDEDGSLIASENVSTYVGPRAHQHITSPKGCRLRIKWILTGVKPLSTFAVTTRGMFSSAATEAAATDHDPMERPRIDPLFKFSRSTWNS
jgi:hypothetical protein